MAIFFETPAAPSAADIKEALKGALSTSPPATADLDAQADFKTANLVGAPTQPRLQTGRLLVAIVIFGLIVGGAIATNAVGLNDSSKVLYGFSTTIFGVVVGLLGGEKASATAGG